MVWQGQDRAKIVSKVQRALFALIQALAQFTVAGQAEVPAEEPIMEQFKSNRARHAQKLVQLEGVTASKFVQAAARAWGVNSEMMF